jgi:hypothetical protein
MKIKNLVITYADDENGVSRPLATAQMNLQGEASDPSEYLFYTNGTPKPMLHTMNLSLLDPRPEDDPNANLTPENIAQIKTDITHHAKDGIYIDWDKQIAAADNEVASATEAVSAGESGSAERLTEAEEWKAVADARVAADWHTWAKAKLARG